MIYWNVSSRVGDRYAVWMNGKMIADYLTFDDCYALVMEIHKMRNK